eukprot:10651792-Alexandrium_andersonii.AAC.1
MVYLRSEVGEHYCSVRGTLGRVVFSLVYFVEEPPPPRHGLLRVARGFEYQWVEEGGDLHGGSFAYVWGDTILPARLACRRGADGGKGVCECWERCDCGRGV